MNDVAITTLLIVSLFALLGSGVNGSLAVPPSRPRSARPAPARRDGWHDLRPARTAASSESVRGFGS